MEMWLIWLIIVIFLSILEVSTVNLVSIWFIASGIISLITSFFIDNFYLQFTIFVILGIIFLITTKKIINKTLKNNKEITNLDRVLKMNAIVTKDIKKNSMGEVKVDGKYWSAISEENLKENDEVIVEKIDGVKLIVRKKEC